MEIRRLQGLALAAASGVLYGSINVLSKPIEMHPFLKSAVAYLVSAALLSPYLRGVRIARKDWPRVFVMGLLGGAVAPLLLFFGLQEAAATDAGLLLTLELVVTALLAMWLLGERFAARETMGLLFLFVAALLVAVASGGEAAQSSLRGVLLVAGAAVAWGVDNNVSTYLVGNYRPGALISVKGFIGGTAALVAAGVSHVPTPSSQALFGMTLIGIFSIGVSSLCFYFALWYVGAGRTSAMNVATTALVGAFGGAWLLGESLHALHFVALAAVGAGSVLLARHGIPAAPGPGTYAPAPNGRT